MEAGDISTLSLCPNGHSLGVSAHEVDMGVNPAENRFLVRQAVVTLETSRSSAEEAQRCSSVAGCDQHQVPHSCQSGTIQQPWTLIGRGVEEEDEDWEAVSLVSAHAHTHMQCR